MIKKIGVENFRIFKDYTEFELKPITLLTGPNNSGKSSLIKLLLLLTGGLGVKQLNFDNQLAKLKDFTSVLSWGKDSNEIIITIEFDGLRFKLFYSDSIIEKIQLLHLGKPFFELQRKKESLLGPYYHRNIKLVENINEIFNNESPIVSFNHSLFYDFLTSYYYLLVDKTEDEFYPDQKDNLLFLEELIKSDLEKDLLINLYKDKKNVTNEYIDELNFLQNEALNKESFPFPSNDWYDLNDIFKIINKIFLELNAHLIDYVNNKLHEKYEKGDFNVKLSKFGQLLFKSVCVIEWKDFNPKKQLDYLDYIPAFRSDQSRVFTKSKIFLDKIADVYFDLKEETPFYPISHDINQMLNYKNLDYIKEVFKIFELKGEIKVERYENTTTAIYLMDGEKKINISDLGYGYSQIISIALKIFNMAAIGSRSEKIILIIEEPEANLHPKYQSKLADLFAFTQKVFSNRLNIIIETHSEYLIRKLQYLTAKEEILSEDSIIYYFNDDKYVSKQEPKVKPIEITKTGGLTDTFGPGFFDENTRIQFALAKLNKSQKK